MPNFIKIVRIVFEKTETFTLRSGEKKTKNVTIAWVVENVFRLPKREDDPLETLEKSHKSKIQAQKNLARFESISFCFPDVKKS